MQADHNLNGLYSISFYRNNTVEFTQPTVFLPSLLQNIFPMMQTELMDIQNSAPYFFEEFDVLVKIVCT